MTECIFPAICISFPQYCGGRRAAFYLAAEEYVATCLPEGNYLFTWQIKPTVVIGRNQNAYAELDVDFCKQEGIDIIRRKSGGGSIFANEGNVMTSLVTGKGAVEQLFREYADNVSASLRALGAEVEVSGRNDIVLVYDGVRGKICGNAFYHLANSNIVHGTMLYDTDLRMMKGALTPQRAKLLSKGVKSVESRIALLKDVLTEMTVAQLQEHIATSLTNRTVHLTDEDISKIEEIERGYYEPSFLLGKHDYKDTSLQCRARIEGCGTVALAFAIENGIVSSVTLEGDYFELGDAEKAFSEAFATCPWSEHHLLERIEEYQPYTTIRGMQKQDLVAMLNEYLKQEHNYD